MQYDLISKLAYSDGLTGLANRTAYLEQLDEIQNETKSSIQLGIVYLDVNNLKDVNEKQGHEMGDELIKIAANIIEDSFGHYGKCYRIGGDEFCVLIRGGNIQEKYGKGLMVFNKLINEANRNGWYSYKIQIAQGFALSNSNTRDMIDEAIEIADDEMYKNKLELKPKQDYISI